MRVFVTGATGFIGSHIVPELIGAGHQVLGLTRSDQGAAALEAQGADVFRGDLDDPDGLRRGAERAEGVIHCAYDHDFSNMAESGNKETRAIAALGDALAESGRPLVVSSVVAMGAAAPGALATEDHFDPKGPNPRKVTEIAAQAAAERGANVSVVRLAQIHDTRKQGFVSELIRVAREKGLSVYVGEGANRWAAAHVVDTARLYRLALERAEPGARYNAIAEEGVPMRTIAETIARTLGLPAKSLSPEEASAHFGWLAPFAAMDMAGSSALTRERLGWNPTGPTLVADLEALQL